MGGWVSGTDGNPSWGHIQHFGPLFPCLVNLVSDISVVSQPGAG